MKSKTTEYKQRAINIWNEVAPFYHSRWVKNEIGPFSVTNDLIKSARIKSGHTVLDSGMWYWSCYKENFNQGRKWSGLWC